MGWPGLCQGHPTLSPSPARSLFTLGLLPCRFPLPSPTSSRGDPNILSCIPASFCPPLGQSWVSWGRKRMKVWALKLLCPWTSHPQGRGDTRPHFRALAEGPTADSLGLPPGQDFLSGQGGAVVGKQQRVGCLWGTQGHTIWLRTSQQWLRSEH